MQGGRPLWRSRELAQRARSAAATSVTPMAVRTMYATETYQNDPTAYIPTAFAPSDAITAASIAHRAHRAPRRMPKCTNASDARPMPTSPPLRKRRHCRHQRFPLLRRCRSNRPAPRPCSCRSRRRTPKERSQRAPTTSRPTAPRFTIVGPAPARQGDSALRCCTSRRWQSGPERLPGRRSAATPTRARRGTRPRGLTSVGARGFEPPTFCSQSRRATRLRHAPFVGSAASLHDGDAPDQRISMSYGRRAW